LDWILSFFVSLDDQIARISRMKAPPLSWDSPTGTRIQNKEAGHKPAPLQSFLILLTGQAAVHKPSAVAADLVE